MHFSSLHLVSPQDPKAKNPILQVVKNRDFPFKNASFPSNEESRVSELLPL